MSDRQMILLIIAELLVFVLVGGVFIFRSYLRRKEMKKLRLKLRQIREKRLPSTIKSISPLLDAGFVEELNLLIEDLMDQRRVLYEKGEETREMVTGISHDFRTPLTSISGYVQILLEREGVISTEERQRYLSIILERTRSMAELVEDFYTYSSLGSSDMQPKLAPADPLGPLRAILAMHYDELELAFEEVQISIPDESLLAHIDKVYLERAFGNLVINALRYGSGTFRVEAIRLDEQLLIVFANRVPDPEVLKSTRINQLFERNFSVNWKSGASSTGLGLPITRSLLQQLGGDLTAEIVDEEFRMQCILPLMK